MHLVYNVHYDIAALAFLFIVFVYMNLMYPKKSVTMIKYRRIIVFLMLAIISDVISSITITYASNVPNWANMFVNTFYFGVSFFLEFSYLEYVSAYLGGKVNKNVILSSKILLGVYLTLLFVNLFWPLVFYFNENHEYCRGPLYYGINVILFYYIIMGFVITVINRKTITKRQFGSFIFFTIMEIAATIIQTFIAQEVLIMLFISSATMIVILFALETPDYQNLTSTLEELRKKQQELELANDAAISAQLDAEKANRAKSAFLASMSHEIRTPINGVLGMNSIILKQAKDPQILEYARNIDNAGNGLLSLVNDILDLSKIESGKMELSPVQYDLSTVLSACYNLEFLKARDKGLDLLFENNTTIPCDLFGDDVRIRQIIVNLLSNAIKYTAEGTVVLTADWEKIDDYNMILIISVKDTGIGITPDNVEHLFDAFARVDEKRNRNIEGTGLGLKITKQFVDMMHGTIHVESDYGIGSEFIVRIPQRIAGRGILGDFANYVHISKEETIDTFSRFKCPTGKLLVVDDVSLNLQVIEGLLRETQMRVDKASSGVECLEKVKAETYDIILLDHMMPGMDGIETFRKLKMMGDVFNRRTPVIMLTANAIRGAKEEYLAEGFTDYLSKPVREQELNEMLIKYLPPEMITVEEVTIGLENGVPEEKKFEAMPVVFDALPVSDDAKSEFSKRFSFLDVDTGLMYCMNNEEFYESIIREFRSSNKYEEIQEAFDRCDLKNYSVNVHGVKSSALTIGANKVSELAKNLEFAAKAEDVDYIKGNHYVFMRAYGELLDNLDEVYGS